LIDDIRYVCGVLDSEASFEINLIKWFNKNGIQVRANASLRVGMADLDTVEYIQAKLQRGRIYTSSYRSKKGKIPFFTLILNEIETKEILGELEGQLITKKRDFELMKLFYCGHKQKAFELLKQGRRGTKHKKEIVELIS
jgi:hypothetical protein